METPIIQVADPEQINTWYTTSLSVFTSTVERSIKISHACTGLQSGERLHWASVIFTRICNTGVTIIDVCPKSKLNARGVNWDFSSIASLVRNLYECCLVFHYLGIENIPDTEWEARLRVMQMHDCLSRNRMFEKLNSEHTSEIYKEQADELRDILKRNPYFTTFTEKQQKKFLDGESASLLSHDEISLRMGTFTEQARGYYRFLSSHAHSFPLAFYRMAEHGRGTGDENLIDKGYIATALEFATQCVKRSNTDMQDAFKHLAKIPYGSFDLGKIAP